MTNNNNDPDQGEREDPKAGVKGAWIAFAGAVAVAVIGVVGTILSGAVHVSTGDQSQAGGGMATTTVSVPVTPTPTPTPPVERAIVSPEENQSAQLCTEVRGTVRKLPADKALVVATREDDDTRIYFEQSVKLGSNGEWRATVNLGDSDNANASVNHHFDIYAVVMDKAWAAYLAGTHDDVDYTFWSTTGWPPGADPGDPRRLIRSAAVGC
ncbi:hypothetical protein ACFVWG_10350 [Kribbella sp. NPDC058245]|uniref:hypothetical protein n=1 Tax=Kribbella sp. NPDC058245 TaxID=3346399 RepID=UPI0036E1FA93